MNESSHLLPGKKQPHRVPAHRRPYGWLRNQYSVPENCHVTPKIEEKKPKTECYKRTSEMMKTGQNKC